MTQLPIQPVSGPITATVRPPGSKSITNRALICAALAEGQSVLSGALVSDDTEVMIEGLRALGISVATREGGTVVEVTGCGGRLPVDRGRDLCQEQRHDDPFFSPQSARSAPGPYTLDGIPRMRERPMGDLLDAFAAVGCRRQAVSSVPVTRRS